MRDEFLGRRAGDATVAAPAAAAAAHSGPQQRVYPNKTRVYPPVRAFDCIICFSATTSCCCCTRAPSFVPSNLSCLCTGPRQAGGTALCLLTACAPPPFLITSLFHATTILMRQWARSPYLSCCKSLDCGQRVAGGG